MEASVKEKEWIPRLWLKRYGHVLFISWSKASPLLYNRLPQVLCTALDASALCNSKLSSWERQTIGPASGARHQVTAKTALHFRWSWRFQNRLSGNQNYTGADLCAESVEERERAKSALGGRNSRSLHSSIGPSLGASSEKTVIFPADVKQLQLPGRRRKLHADCHERAQSSMWSFRWQRIPCTVLLQWLLRSLPSRSYLVHACRSKNLSRSSLYCKPLKQAFWLFKNLYKQRPGL